MELQTTSCHETTCGAVCLQYCVKVLRHSNFHSVPFCRTCGISGMPAAVSLLYFYIVTDAKRRTLSLFACLSTQHVNMFLEVFKSTLQSPSSDTRSYATHVSEPCHTARIQLRCTPCMNVHVLEKRTEVRHTDAQRDGQKDQELDVKRRTRGSLPPPFECKSLPRIRSLHACTLRHRTRSPPDAEKTTKKTISEKVEWRKTSSRERSAIST